MHSGHRSNVAHELGAAERTRKETRVQLNVRPIDNSPALPEEMKLRGLIKILLFRVAALTKLPRAVVEESEELQVRIELIKHRTDKSSRSD